MGFRAGAVLGLLGGVALVGACSGSSTPTGFGNDDGGGASSSSGSNGSSGSGGSSSGTGSSSGVNLGASSSGTSSSSGSSGGTVTTTTVYAHTDSELYSLNPSTMVLTDIGPFVIAGSGGSTSSGGSNSASMTDLAVDAAGDVYVNSETVVYKAALPSGGTGSVNLTQIATIAVASGQSFYALAFTPKDALGTGTGEVLIGGDGNGEVWSIDTTSGATKDLGSFGANPTDSAIQMGVSGDIVFYMDSSGSATGLATIRGCAGSNGCSSSSSSYTTDYLVGIDMTALASAYANGTPATSLNAGYYGAMTSSDTGPGIGYKEVFGLGAWNGSVFGFTHETPITLLTIATSGSGAGVGTVAANTTSSGWAGAGVTTSVTVTVAPPPIPPQ